MPRLSNPVAKAISNPTLRNAINAKCAECMGCTRKHIEAGFIEDIRGCVAVGCPLHPFRPYQEKP